MCVYLYVHIYFIDIHMNIQRVSTEQAVTFTLNYESC